MDIQGTFWRFSLKLYADRVVSKVCLELQESHGADVNILLFLLYQGTQGKQLSMDTVMQINRAVLEWRETVIQPIRVIRQRLKNQPYELSSDDQSQLRKELLAVELQAEKSAQLHLEGLDIEFLSSNKDQATQANVALYARLLRIKSDNESINTLIHQALLQSPSY